VTDDHGGDRPEGSSDDSSGHGPGGDDSSGSGSDDDNSGHGGGGDDD
jgi:hypothetical protein